MELLKIVVLGNPLWGWALAAGIAVGAFAALRLVLRVSGPRLARLAHRLATAWPGYLADALARTRAMVLAIIAIRLGSLGLVLPPRVVGALGALTGVALLLQAGGWSTSALTAWLHRYREQRFAEDRGATTTVTALAFAAQIVLWSVVVLCGHEADVAGYPHRVGGGLLSCRPAGGRQQSEHERNVGID